MALPVRILPYFRKCILLCFPFILGVIFTHVYHFNTSFISYNTADGVFSSVGTFGDKPGKYSTISQNLHQLTSRNVEHEEREPNTPRRKREFSDSTLVEWSTRRILQQIAAYSAPSDAELREAIKEEYGFDEKPPLAFIKEWKNPCWFGKSAYKISKLKCLPAFYIPGFPKSATMDLWFRLKRHPQLRAIGNWRETNWWNRLRYDQNNQSRTLLGQFSGILGNSLQKWGKKIPNLILGEGTPSYIWYGHTDIRANYTATDFITHDVPRLAPRVLTAHLIREYTPKAKFIVTMRNPADRLFSHFCYFGNQTRNPNDFAFKRSQARFHRLVVQLVAMYQDCFSRRSVRECAYDPNMSFECNFSKVRIDRTLYAVYVSDWLRIFPREQFYFVKSETYRDNMTSVLNDMFKFLGLKQLSPKSIDFIARQPHRHTKELYSIHIPPMWDETRRILNDFFRPFNEALATILRDDSFLWKEETS